MRKLLPFLTLLLPSFALAQGQVERWNRYEISLTAPQREVKGNPFDVQLSATFVHNGDTLVVTGYYDGPGDKKGEERWKVRFMPTEVGNWSYLTSSHLPSLNNKSGQLTCTPASIGNHGPVQVDSTGLHFCYADGSRYMPIGTTSYDWMHASNAEGVSIADPGLTMQQQTLQSLSESGFNKIRSLLTVQNFNRSYPEPDCFPFMEREQKADAPSEESRWDWTRLNPRYFDHVEACTDGLMKIGVEQDLIMFHPYDDGRWGFDQMPLEAGLLLCRYVAARFGSFRNIWWSLANEYDLVKGQAPENWTAWTDEILKYDPYHHLISIHSYTAQYYSYWDDRFTHCSIQDQAPVEDFGRAIIARNIFKKPVIYDEVCYEGDMTERWGWLSGEEELHRMWQALIVGTYCTHSECYQFGDPKDFRRDFLAVGGKWQGESWKRTKFMQQILSEMPRPMYLPDSSWDPYTSACGPGYYMVYLGKKVAKEWRFDLPIRNGRGAAAFPRMTEGERYEVEIIDTWNMTVTKCPGIFVTKKQDNYRMIEASGKNVDLPELPYLLLRIKRVD